MAYQRFYCSWGMEIQPMHPNLSRYHFTQIAVDTRCPPPLAVLWFHPSFFRWRSLWQFDSRFRFIVRRAWTKNGLWLLTVQVYKLRETKCLCVILTRYHGVLFHGIPLPFRSTVYLFAYIFIKPNRMPNYNRSSLLTHQKIFNLQCQTLFLNRISCHSQNFLLVYVSLYKFYYL